VITSPVGDSLSAALLEEAIARSRRHVVLLAVEFSNGAKSEVDYQS
jgi:hypothetical protein